MVDTAGEKKYEHLGYIAKAALTLSHGSAAPERGFSVNNALTQEKGSLAERSIVALRVFKEAIRFFGSCTNVPMTKDLLQSVKRAHAEYAIMLYSLRMNVSDSYLNKKKGRRNKLKKRNELRRKPEVLCLNS